MKKLLVLLMLVTMFACVRKEEPVKDDFLNSTTRLRKQMFHIVKKNLI